MEENFTTQSRSTTILSWLGPMLLGVIFLFAGSVYASKQPISGGLRSLPQAGNRSLAEGGDVVPDQLPPSRPLVPLLNNPTSTFTGDLTAESVIALDDRTDTILYEKNSTEIRSLASISKLLTSLVLVDLPMKWASTTVITEADFDGSTHVKVGEKYTLEDLFHIALVGSSNTAINALARSSGLTSAEFVDRLNAKAEDLHLNSIHVVEPTGLDAQNVGNVIDVARLLEEALNNERIRTILQTGEYYAEPLGQAKKRRIWNTNWLLTKWIPSDYDKDEAIGKTGYITNSLYNVAMRFETERHHALRIVVFGSASNEARFTEARDLADWIFKDYVWPDEPGYDQLAE